ncbi:MAG TPA: TetR/AcrR family transcriptional regulator [Jatrophihabitans sp.]|nr:TetR/AcrR family transcriptional regulator [Jatrophihabitans sp.]
MSSQGHRLSDTGSNGAEPPHRFDPLTDVLLRPTDRPQQPGAGQPARGSVAARSRAAILDGARAAVLANGSKITMAQVAARAGVAKATLYNHYRAREDVLRDLLLAEIDTVISAVEYLPLSNALYRAAVAVSENPLLEALGAQDPAGLSVLAMIDVRAPGWARVAQAVDRLLARQGRRGTPTVLRWLSSFVLAPADTADIGADVDVLVAGLPPSV